MKSIIEYSFWLNLEDIIEILKPIYDCQIISKSRDIYLDYIVK